MKEMLQRIKADMILSAVICVAMGVAIFVWPGQILNIFGKILAVGLIIMGIVYVISYVSNRSVHPFSGVLGLIVLLVGIWVFLKPESIASVVPIVIGVIMFVHGIQDIKLALENRQNGYEKWWTMLIVAAISLLFGVLCVVYAFGMAKLALQVIGVALIFDGISDLWVVSKTVRMAKTMKEEADALDIDYKEL